MAQRPIAGGGPAYCGDISLCIAAIRQSSEPGIVLSRRYSVSPSQISSIRTGKKWKAPPEANEAA
jgi:hypothetical protein